MQSLEKAKQNSLNSKVFKESKVPRPMWYLYAEIEISANVVNQLFPKIWKPFFSLYWEQVCMNLRDVRIVQKWIH